MPFEKGNNLALRKFDSEYQPANRGRKPGSRNVSTVLREMMERLAPGEVVSLKFVKEFCKTAKGNPLKKVTNADAIAARLINEGLIKGEAWAIKELLDRTEGKAPQSLDVTSNGNDLMPRKHQIELIDSREQVKEESYASE